MTGRSIPPTPSIEDFTYQAWLDRLIWYKAEVKEPYSNPRSKVDQLESLTATEISLYKSKVENLETAEKITYDFLYILCLFLSAGVDH